MDSMNMLSTGRKTAKFPRELASADPGCLGATSSEGVLHTFQRHPTPVTSAPRDACLYSQVTEEITELLGSRGSSAWSKQFHIPTILG